jgi:hypothetical protein
MKTVSGILVLTRFFGPTDFRGARVSASIWRGGELVSKAIESPNHGGTGKDVHIPVAIKALKKFLGESALHRDGYDAVAVSDAPDGRGYSFLFFSSDLVD